MTFRSLRFVPALGALVACTALAPTQSVPAPPFTQPAAAPCTNATKLAGWSTTRLAMLTIVVPVAETSPGDVTDEVAQGAGGVLLFGSRAPSNLHTKLSALRRHVPGRIGLLVMTDEEGGGVQRMANLVGSLPWAQTMGKKWTAAQIRTRVRTVARKMSAAGVNMDLAPVADVDGRAVPPSASNPDGLRAFGGNTATVSRDTVAYLEGLRDGGVIPVVKHFPGLGHASRNTDYGPAHTLSWTTEKRVAIPPFEAAIAAGVPAVMMSNASVPGLATNPGSLSPTQISKELRSRLGFTGLVLTDSLTAKAISDGGWTASRAAVQALRSGADMVLFGPVTDVQAHTNAIKARIVAAVSTGVLTRARLIDAAEHILGVRHVNLCG